MLELYKVLYGEDAERRLKEDLNDLTEESKAKIFRITKALVDDKVKMLANIERIQNDFQNWNKAQQLMVM